MVVRNCSEYMHLDNSACNLASINLLTFLDDDGDVRRRGFKAAVEVVFTAQEILVGNADYPTEKIAETSRKFRQLGLGYANLGALLMALGMPYDSDAGRAWAGAITALMTGHAYATSRAHGRAHGPVRGLRREQRAHAARAADAPGRGREDRRGARAAELLGAAQQSWDEAVELAEQFGVRNSQATVLAPTGTIGFMMDCDTTGIEPDLGLVKTKKLVGGGTMSIVNQTVPRALARLGYAPFQIDSIVAYIDEQQVDRRRAAPEGRAPPGVRVLDGRQRDPLHGPRADDGGRAAVHQRAPSPRPSTCPKTSTVEDVEDLHIEAWKLGLKAVAIYRDNCKVAQPLSTKKKEADDAVAA